MPGTCSVQRIQRWEKWSSPCPCDLTVQPECPFTLLASGTLVCSTVLAPRKAMGIIHPCSPFRQAPRGHPWFTSHLDSRISHLQTRYVLSAEHSSRFWRESRRKTKALLSWSLYSRVESRTMKWCSTSNDEDYRLSPHIQVALGLEVNWGGRAEKYRGKKEYGQLEWEGSEDIHLWPSFHCTICSHYRVGHLFTYTFTFITYWYKINKYLLLFIKI